MKKTYLILLLLLSTALYADNITPTTQAITPTAQATAETNTIYHRRYKILMFPPVWQQKLFMTLKAPFRRMARATSTPASLV